MAEPTRRTRPQKQLTLARDVYEYLDQPEVNASRLVEAAVREKVSSDHIEKAASQAGMTDEEIDAARQK